MRIWGTLSATVCLSVMVGGCLPQTTGIVSTTQIPGYALSACEYVVEANAQACAERARAQKNGDIAMALATYLTQKPDADGAFQWTQDAAAWGNSRALRTVYDSYSTGKWQTPGSKDMAAQTLEQAIAANAQWAKMLQASRLWRSDPATAQTLLKDVAERNNCHAQAFLASAYYDGSLGEKNWTKAYFWLLLGQSGATARISEIHTLTKTPDASSPPNGFMTETCLPGRLPTIRASMERLLPPRYVLSASNAVLKWRPNASEPDLAAPPDDALVEQKPLTPAPNRLARQASILNTTPKWQEVAFERTALRTDQQLSATDLFERASAYVWVVAVSSGQRGSISQGSAVAIAPHRLITNCHVVEDARAIAIKQGKDIRSAALVSASPETDRCVLSVDKPLPAYARAIRSFDSLKVGEAVVSIGSPLGLENTLGQGIVSGLRRIDGMRVIQTTAAISSGSSGGGLFDGNGNLIGITTFALRDADSLNFAIAAENFAKAQ